ncbi:MAG: hypothetical protein QOE90_359 [Thermoplasmata archaeon]|nr:hypothetical protein [Thermoplasmata archaeon]
MTRIAFALALALLAAVPVASAGWFSSDPVTVNVASLRAGDRLSYVEHTTKSHFTDEYPPRLVVEPATYEHTLFIEGAGTAQDGYGIARASESYRHDQMEGGKLVRSEICDALPGSNVSIRLKPLIAQTAGGSMAWGTTGFGPLDLGSTQGQQNESLVASYGGMPCFGQQILGGRAFHEGDRVPFGAVIPDPLPGAMAQTLSAPLTATTYHGRAALLMRYHLAKDGQDLPVSILVADGLPGVVNLTVPSLSGTKAWNYTLELSGFEAGNGPALAPYARAALPEKNPAARFQAPDRLRFEDAAFGLPLRYDDAYRAATLDPTTGLASWLQSHPDARLLFARWFADTYVDRSAATSPDGTWSMTFLSGGETYGVSVSRDSAGFGAVRQPIPLVGPPTDSGFKGHMSGDPGAMPAEVASSDALAPMMRGQGVDASRLQELSVSLFAGRSLVTLSDSLCCNANTPAEGHMVVLDAGRAAVYAVLETSSIYSETGPLVAASQRGLDAPRQSAMSALAGPALGVGLEGGAAVTLLALLLLAAKLLLVPLFTRLRRGALLDNPVRARLYDRIRLEPGIPESELVDFAGVGRGATVRHLDQLRRHGYVVELREDARKRYFAAGEVPPALARREAILRAGRARDVYELFLAEPTMSLREAAARLGISAPSVHRAKKKLEKAGLLPAAAEASLAALEA